MSGRVCFGERTWSRIPSLFSVSPPQFGKGFYGDYNKIPMLPVRLCDMTSKDRRDGRIQRFRHQCLAAVQVHNGDHESSMPRHRRVCDVSRQQPREIPEKDSPPAASAYPPTSASFPARSDGRRRPPPP